MAEQIVTSSTAPWAPLQPYLQSGFGRAEQLYQTGGPNYFPGSTVAPFGADTTNALNMFRQNATQGTPVPGAATNQIASTLSGDYLNSNPYLDAMYNNAANRVTEHYQEAVAPSIAHNFGMAGRSGSGMYSNAMQNSQTALADSLGGMAANIYGGNYANERSNQMTAAGMAPQIAPMGYYDASQLLNVGETMDTKAQQNVTDAYGRYMFEQERPYDNLGRYMMSLGGNYGTQKSEPFSPLAQNLGLAATGIGLGNELLRGTSYGSVGGLLGSLFGF